MQFGRLLWHRDRMQIDDAIKTIMRLLQLDEFDDGTEVISKVQIAGRLHAGKDARNELGHVGKSSATRD